MARLVDALGDEDFAVREDASTRLRESEHALPLLEAAARSRDPEVRRRALAAHRHLIGFLATRGLERIVPQAADGRADLLPEAARAWGKQDPSDLLFQTAAFVAERAARKGQPLQELKIPITLMPKFSARGIRKTLRDPLVARAFGDTLGVDDLRAVFAIAGSIKTGSDGGGIRLATDGYKSARGGHVTESILIANGDVVLQGAVVYSLVICDGKVTLGRGCECSIIIARNGIDARGAAGKRNVLSSCGPVVGGRYFFEANVRRPLGYVRFFEVSDVGLTLDSLTVKAAAPKSRLAHAGLLKGDVFVSVDGVAAKDADTLRRSLRKRYVLGGVSTFVVLRAGKGVTLRARLTDD